MTKKPLSMSNLKEKVTSIIEAHFVGSGRRVMAINSLQEILSLQADINNNLLEVPLCPKLNSKKYYKVGEPIPKCLRNYDLEQDPIHYVGMSEIKDEKIYFEVSTNIIPTYDSSYVFCYLPNII